MIELELWVSIGMTPKGTKGGTERNRLLVNRISESQKSPGIFTNFILKIFFLTAYINILVTRTEP